MAAYREARKASNNDDKKKDATIPFRYKVPHALFSFFKRVRVLELFFFLNFLRVLELGGFYFIFFYKIFVCTDVVGIDSRAYRKEVFKCST